MDELGPDEREPEFYSDADALLALGEGLKHLDLDVTAVPWRTSGVPYWVQEENERAVAKVKAAIRYLCAEDS